MAPTISYTYDPVGNRTLLAQQWLIDDQHLQCGQRIGDQPNELPG